MEKTRKIFTVLFILTSCVLYAQDVDSLLTDHEALDLFSNGDSLSLFALVDSLLALEELEPVSQLAVRLGYNSNVLAAGRTLGVENFGLSPGLSYYHTSGAYADVTGFWSKDFDPKYYLTIATLGYSRLFTKHFSVIGSYDRYLYNVPDDSFVPYRNSLSITPTLTIRPVNVSIGYSYFFGDKQVHRVFLSLNITVQKKKIWGLDRIAVVPTFCILLGSEQFTISELLIPRSKREALQNYLLYKKFVPEIITTHTEFGVMNYSFSLPISVSYKKINFIVNYIYNIPKALPSETLVISKSSFLSASLIYTFDLKRNKNLWE
jgi:hypothetical protein